MENIRKKRKKKKEKIYKCFQFLNIIKEKDLEIRNLSVLKLCPTQLLLCIIILKTYLLKHLFL